MQLPPDLATFAPIPQPRTPLVGREREIAAVRAALRDPGVPLVTLTGAGGSGKTRIALMVATTAAEDFPDGTVFVGLASVNDPALVLPTIAQALGVREAGDRTLADRLQETIAGRRLLLVLDNLEQVATATPLLADLLAACPNLTILATSRAVLRISGEHVFPVPPLSVRRETSDVRRESEPSSTHVSRLTTHVSDASALFVQRARAANPNFALTDDIAPCIAEIVRRVDGLPLAIELAAARLRTFSLAELLALLDDRLRILTGGARDLPDRQRTMRDAIAWSHELLTPDEQRLFRRLAVFAGGCTARAAAAACGEPGEETATIDLLGSLVDQSLLHRQGDADGESRYLMLETVRAFATEQLSASGEEPAIRHAHARYFVALAERMWSCWTAPPYRGLERLVELESWLRRLKPELGNIRAALTWTIEHAPPEAVRLAGALDWYWPRHGHFAEGRWWVERSLAAAAEVPAADRARAVMVAGWLALQQVDLPQADAWLTEAVDSYRALGDPGLLATALSRHGPVALARGDLALARRLHEEERDHALVSGDPILAVIATANLGRVAAGMGELARAEALLEKAVAGHRTFTGPYPTAIVLGFLGDVVLARGDAARAAGHYREALATFAAGGDWADLARWLEGLMGATVVRWPAPSARLLGAMAALRERIGRPRDSEDRPAYERTLNIVRAGLNPGAFAESWAEGQQMPLDEAIAEALALATTAAGAPATDPVGSVPHHGLTPRELEVLRLVAVGRSNREIAGDLFISVPTVKRHITNILGKLGVSSRSDAAAYTRSYGIA